MRTELFYKRLERLLKNKGLQQKDLAEKCGISSNGELAGIHKKDELAYTVAMLPDNKRRVVQAVIDSLKTF